MQDQNPYVMHCILNRHKGKSHIMEHLESSTDPGIKSSHIYQGEKKLQRKCGVVQNQHALKRQVQTFHWLKYKAVFNSSILRTAPSESITTDDYFMLVDYLIFQSFAYHPPIQPSFPELLRLIITYYNHPSSPYSPSPPCSIHGLPHITNGQRNCEPGGSWHPVSQCEYQVEAR